MKLFGLFFAGLSRKDQMKPVKLFISYAHEDEEYKDQLVKQLSGLLRRGWVEEWNDRKITAGQQWETKIKNALNTAEVMLLLLSADAMASDYIYDEEMKQAIQRSKDGQLKILPIIIRSCDFSNFFGSLGLSDIEILPHNKQAIRSWDNRDAAWLDVVKGIEEIITALRGETPDNSATTASTNDDETTASDATDKLVINDHHRYTCDRVDQNDAFKVLFKQKQNNKAQFYYLYGSDMQSHLGFFNRISYDLEGRLQDYLNADLKASCRSLRIELNFELSNNLEFYKENIIKSLFAAFSIPVNDHEPLLEKDLAFAYGKSPNLKGLIKEDFICIFISISDYDWDPDITPQATKWFIKNFCDCLLPDDAPTFLFFFAIQYEDDDDELKKEIESIILESKSIDAMPELNMVKMRDIKKWMNTYKAMVPNKNVRNNLIKQYFSADEFYMEDLENTFQQLIDEYNDRG